MVCSCTRASICICICAPHYAWAARVAWHFRPPVLFLHAIQKEERVGVRVQHVEKRRQVESVTLRPRIRIRELRHELAVHSPQRDTFCGSSSSGRSSCTRCAVSTSTLYRCAVHGGEQVQDLVSLRVVNVLDVRVVRDVLRHGRLHVVHEAHA